MEMMSRLQNIIPQSDDDQINMRTFCLLLIARHHRLRMSNI